MSIEIIKELNIDFYNKKYITVDAKQYDVSSRFILVTCYNQGALFSLKNTEHSAFIRYKKADGNGVFNQCTITKEGKIRIELTEQMLSVSGDCTADIVILDKLSLPEDGSVSNYDEFIRLNNSSIISTMSFCVHVAPTTLDNSEIESSYEYNALNDLLKKATTDYDQIIEQTNKSLAGVERAIETSTDKIKAHTENADIHTTKAEKTKLAGVEDGANKYTHPTTSGNKHIPSGGSSGQFLKWSSDGTAAWGNDNNTTYSAGTGLSLSGTVMNHSNSVTAGTAQGDASKTLSFGGTFTVPSVTYDGQGHITGKSTTTMTMPATPIDVRVYQQESTADTYRALLMGTNNYENPTALGTSVTGQTYLTPRIYAKPSAGELFATGGFKGNADTATRLSWTDIAYKTMDINDINYANGYVGGIWFCQDASGSANISNIPVKYAFLLEYRLLRKSTPTDFVCVQTFYSSIEKEIYERFGNQNGWNEWVLKSKNGIAMNAYKIVPALIPNNSDLNTYNTESYCGLYYANGSNGISNRPTSVDAFSLEIIKVNNTVGICQRLLASDTVSMYTRFYRGSWTSWRRVVSDADVVNSATKLATPRTISLKGDATASGPFDGSNDLTLDVSVRKLALIGSDAENNNAGWFKVASQTMVSDGQTANITFLVTTNHTKYTSGILQLQIYHNSGVLTLQSFSCLVRRDLDLSHFRLVINGATWTLYTYIGGRYQIKSFEILGQANRYGREVTGLVFENNNKMESIAPSVYTAPVDAGQVEMANQLAAERAIQVKLDASTTAKFNGQSDITTGVTGILPITKGGTGSIIGNAPTASKLLTARNINGIPFDGSKDITIPVGGGSSSSLVWTGFTRSVDLDIPDAFKYDVSCGAYTVKAATLLIGAIFTSSGYGSVPVTFSAFLMWSASSTRYTSYTGTLNTKFLLVQHVPDTIDSVANLNPICIQIIHAETGNVIISNPNSYGMDIISIVAVH